MIKKYRRKPVILEAIQWTGDNTDEVLDFGQGKIKCKQYKYCPNGKDIIYDKELYIETLEGKLRASKGDYIIKGVKGEFYPCKPDVFEKIYEEIKERKVDVINEKAVIDAVNEVKHEEGYPYFVDFGDFAILNKDAFLVYLRKHYSEMLTDELENLRCKIKKIKEILENE